MLKLVRSILLLLGSLPAAAQTPYLVRDINTTRTLFTKSSDPADFLALGSRILFVATVGETGRELWSTDGTSEGTSIVSDIVAGAGGSDPSSLTVLNGVVFFSARTADHGVELWVTDGTAAGTRLVRDIQPGPSSSSPGGLRVHRGGLLFSADDGASGRELWTTDGTAAGTRMVADIEPGSKGSSPTAIVALADAAYFGAAGALWKTDGTQSGTVNVAPVNVRGLTAAGSRLFFAGTLAGSDWEPWVTDGTEAGTRLVAHIRPGALGSLTDGAFFTAIGSRVLFVARDASHGREVWGSDGTTAGTELLHDAYPGSSGRWDVGGGPAVAVLGGLAYFEGFDPDHGSELWVTDGTAAGTTLFAEVAPGKGTSPRVSSIVVSAGRLFIAVETRIWISDGKANGTSVLESPIAYAGSSAAGNALVPVGGKVYFAGRNELSGSEPAVTDGTAEGTRIIANLAIDDGPSSYPSVLTAAGSQLFFYADDGLPPYVPALWRSDGTSEGTIRLMESRSPAPPLTAAGPLVFFDDDPDRAKRFMSDGTPEGTKPIADFLKRFDGAALVDVYPFGETLFASVLKPTETLTSLWRTAPDVDASAVPLGAKSATAVVEVAGRFLFTARPARPLVDPRGLWLTDGTPAGTRPIVPDLGSPSIIGKPATAGGSLFFFMAGRNEDPKLWKSDGTFEGTMLVTERVRTTFSKTQIVAAGRRIFFIAGNTLWSSDGTDAGTSEIGTINLWNDWIGAAGERIVFVQTRSNGSKYELWTSDGTKEGTKLLHALAEWWSVATIDGVVWFAGSDDVHGTEIWTSDGTVEGTRLFLDLNPGPADSLPGEFTKVGNRLFLRATYGATGSELWAIPLTESALSIEDARALEGDVAKTAARFTVRLDPPSAAVVTVGYETLDGTAKRGEDYEAAAGSLTFAPGETTKTVDVLVAGDRSLESNESFFLALRNASGARVARLEGIAVIEEDDRAVDLSVVPRFASVAFGDEDLARVSNGGPSAATDIAVAFTATPQPALGLPCWTCFIPQIAVGTWADTGVRDPSYRTQIYMTATATARERDLDPRNNAVGWTYTDQLALDALYLTPGQTATVYANGTPKAIVNSDPTVLSVPPSSTEASSGPYRSTFTVKALGPGTANVRLVDQDFGLDVIVVAAGAVPRYPGGLSITIRHGERHDFGQPVTVLVKPAGTAPFSGAKATGTVTVTAGETTLASRSVESTGEVALESFVPATGSIPLRVAYSGDTNFQPQFVDRLITVIPGSTTIQGILRPVSGSAGTFTLAVEVTGSPVAAPTGSIEVLHAGNVIATLALTPSAGKSAAQTTLANLPAAPTLTLRYGGDRHYRAESQQVRLAESRRRAVRR